jgi:hypothetical protein
LVFQKSCKDDQTPNNLALIAKHGKKKCWQVTPLTRHERCWFLDGDVDFRDCKLAAGPQSRLKLYDLRRGDESQPLARIFLVLQRNVAVAPVFVWPSSIFVTSSNKKSF